MHAAPASHAYAQCSACSNHCFCCAFCVCSYNPAKVRGVEVTHARRFLAYSIDQPHMLLHELAHGFHGRVLGWDNEDVLQCYEVRLV